MKRSVCLLVGVLVYLLATTACKGRNRARVQTEEETPALSSMVYMADPRASHQLLKGFHDIEQNAWRWTMGRFSVLLRPPRGAAEKGAVLQLKFVVPEAVIAKLQSTTLSATVNGALLKPETYSAPGEYTYSREVDPKLLGGEAATVDFSLDKSLPPGSADQRELGIIVTMVGFEAK
jgi:hypothetical protein